MFKLKFQSQSQQSSWIYYPYSCGIVCELQTEKQNLMLHSLNHKQSIIQGNGNSKLFLSLK